MTDGTQQTSGQQPGQTSGQTSSATASSPAVSSGEQVSGASVSSGGTQQTSGQQSGQTSGQTSSGSQNSGAAVTQGDAVTAGSTTQTTVSQDPNYQTTAPVPSNDDTTGYDPKTGFALQYGKITVYWFDQYGSYSGSQVVVRQGGQGAPGNATFVKPGTAPTGQVAVFTPSGNNDGLGTWAFEEDHRNQVVYAKADASEVLWMKPGPLPSTYTTVKPANQYVTWNETTGAWDVNQAALTAALKVQAMQAISQTVLPAVQLTTAMGQSLGPNFKAYVEQIQAIAYGRNTTATSLPTAPADPTT